MAELLNVIEKINFYLSDYILTVLLVGAGVFFTFKTRFVQVRCFRKGFGDIFRCFSLKSEKSSGAVSSFSALATAIAGQVGTGNIVGACSAILVGGPGAVFWMWVIAFFSMATIYAEAVLAQQTKSFSPDGSFYGGPVHYIKKAFPSFFGKLLAGFFSVSTILSLGFMGTAVQSNALSKAVGNAFSVKPEFIGLAVAVLCLFVFWGGVKALTGIAEKIVPVMAAIYIAGCLTVLVFRAKYIPETFFMIFKYAFVPSSVIGGSLGFALKTVISQGAKRGLFSNEAGMGSTPHAHALADVKTPHEQGVAAMVGLFIDTFVVLTLTALAVINTLYTNGGKLYLASSANDMVQFAFSSVFGKGFGEKIIAVSLFFFAFSSIISWNYFGKLNVQALFKRKKVVAVYGFIAAAFVFIGSFLSVELVWSLSDLFNQLMVFPNIIALFKLSKDVAKSS